MATSKIFSTKDAVKYGWDTTKKNIWFFLGLLLIPCAISWLVSFTTGALYGQSDIYLSLVGFLLTIAGWIVGVEISYAQVVILFKLFDKKKAEISDLFAFFQADILSRYFLVSLLYGLMVAVGIMLFIIPGIYLGIKYGFAAFIFVDKKTGVLESFKKSAKLTKGAKWQLFWFGILMSLIIMAGALVFGVGLLFALPTAYLAEVYVYRKLAGHKHQG